MRPSRVPAVAIALLAAALAVAGCGLGAGEQVGEVTLTVTRDHGSEAIAGPMEVEVSESDTVMRVLDRETEIETRYGGGFVQAIEGIAGGQGGDRPHDWIFYVNGLWSPVGAAEFPLRGGEAIWWDYRNWSASNQVSALVGSWPQPFADGYEGERHPTALECRAAAVTCELVRSRLRDAGAALAAPGAEGAIRVLAGPWERLRQDPVAAGLGDGPGVSGVYAEVEPRGDGFELVGLDEDGEPARTFGAGTGLVAAMRSGLAPPVWLVTGTSERGALAAARALDAASLRDHYAIAIEGGRVTALPSG